ncbi:hypothetical protein Ga0466249_001678 [Sporomusaceae bacterium BoRhaA]|uniref:LamG domain-containing protein n=1 Tax=Pelorhabdus rhamnosifermentans TaxID=2772457 RepID=UPI001C06280A|nr:LamG domain-containing protein [Pelorhabdus rhamnosifermentans]MBU2700586.1 hypothetical protein [Pelorhabdus rhamnosifermentans]
MYEMDQYTVSLLHFDDGIKDESGKVWTAYGGVAVSTDQKIFGNSSLFLDGVDDYLSMPMSSDFSFTGDFTIDAEVFIPSDVIIDSKTTAFGIFQIGNHWNNSQFFEFSITDGFFNVLLYDTNEYLMQMWNPITIAKNVFNHFAVIRKGSQWYAICNGKVVGSVTYNGTFFPSAEVNIGAYLYDGNRQYIKGYIDELRVSKVARWIMSSLNAVADSDRISLSWTTVTDAVGYSVKRSTTPGGPYETIATNITGTSYVDDTVKNGTTYYYVVTYVDCNGHESMNSNEASTTPLESSKALLVVTVIDSSDHDYQLSPTEIDSFVNWFMNHASTDTAGYMLNKKVGTQESKEYLAFEKIISFEIMPLTK